MTALELVSAVLGGGGITALAGYATARRNARSAERKAQSGERKAELIHDERVAPLFMERLLIVEEKLETCETRYEAMSERAQRAEDSAEECADRYEELNVRTSTLEIALEERDAELLKRARETMSSTPPGAWSKGDA